MSVVTNHYQYLKIFSQYFDREPNTVLTPVKMNILENRFKRRPFLKQQFHTLLSLTKNIDPIDAAQVGNLKKQVDDFLNQFFRLDIFSLNASTLLITANEIFLHRHFFSKHLRVAILKQKEYAVNSSLYTYINEIFLPLITKPDMQRLFCKLLDIPQFSWAFLNFLVKSPDITRSLYDHLYLITNNKAVSANRYQLFHRTEKISIESIPKILPSSN